MVDEHDWQSCCTNTYLDVSECRFGSANVWNSGQGWCKMQANHDGETLEQNLNDLFLNIYTTNRMLHVLQVSESRLSPFAFSNIGFFSPVGVAFTAKYSNKV